jgi:Anticodon binding domain
VKKLMAHSSYSASHFCWPFCPLCLIACGSPQLLSPSLCSCRHSNKGTAAAAASAPAPTATTSAATALAPLHLLGTHPHTHTHTQCCLAATNTTRSLPLCARVPCHALPPRPRSQQVRSVLRSARLHVDVDLSGRKMQKKVREAQLAQYNYILVVGEQEMVRKGVTGVALRWSITPGCS